MDSLTPLDEEAGVAYTHRHIDFRTREQYSTAYLALNPNGRVPCMIDGELVLFESGAICLHIARKDPARRLLPAPGTAAESLHDQWMFWICTELEQALWSMGKHRFALPAEHRIPAMQQTALFAWQRPAPVLADALAGRTWLVGDHLTVADLVAAQTLSWARGFGVPLGSDVLEAYVDRLLARPAYARVQALAP